MRSLQAMESDEIATHPTTTHRKMYHAVDIETMFWQSLDMDSFTRDIDSGKSSPTASVEMGTQLTYERCGGCPADTNRADCTPRLNPNM